MLFFQVSNEVVNGFWADDFEKKIGISKEQLKAMFWELRSIPMENAAIIELEQVSIIRGALSLTLEELGIDESHTRTGFDFERAQQILDQLDLLIPSEIGKLARYNFCFNLSFQLTPYCHLNHLRDTIVQ